MTAAGIETFDVGVVSTEPELTTDPCPVCRRARLHAVTLALAPFAGSPAPLPIAHRYWCAACGAEGATLINDTPGRPGQLARR